MSTLGAFTWDLRVEGSEGEHEDGRHALEEEPPREPGARHVRYAARKSRVRPLRPPAAAPRPRLLGAPARVSPPKPRLLGSPARGSSRSRPTSPAAARGPASSLLRPPNPRQPQVPPRPVQPHPRRAQKPARPNRRQPKAPPTARRLLSRRRPCATTLPVRSGRATRGIASWALARVTS